MPHILGWKVFRIREGITLAVLGNDQIPLNPSKTKGLLGFASSLSWGAALSSTIRTGSLNFLQRHLQWNVSLSLQSSKPGAGFAYKVPTMIRYAFVKNSFSNFPTFISFSLLNMICARQCRQIRFGCSQGFSTGKLAFYFLHSWVFGGNAWDDPGYLETKPEETKISVVQPHLLHHPQATDCCSKASQASLPNYK